MRSWISLRVDFDSEGLRRLAWSTKDAARAIRLLAPASIYDGGSRYDAARLGLVTLQIVRDSVLRFNERCPENLINVVPPDQNARLNDPQRAALAQASSLRSDTSRVSFRSRLLLEMNRLLNELDRIL